MTKPTTKSQRVRVSYRRGERINGQRGWSYLVVDADDTSKVLSEGWSAGKKADAVMSFRQSAIESGWVIS